MVETIDIRPPLSRGQLLGFRGESGLYFSSKKAVKSKNRTPESVEIKNPCKNRTDDLLVFSFACYQLSHNSRGRESRAGISGGGSGGRVPVLGFRGRSRISIVSTTCIRESEGRQDTQDMRQMWGQDKHRTVLVTS